MLLNYCRRYFIVARIIAKGLDFGRSFCRLGSILLKRFFRFVSFEDSCFNVWRGLLWLCRFDFWRPRLFLKLLECFESALLERVGLL